MRTVTVEEHWFDPELYARVPAERAAETGWPPLGPDSHLPEALLAEADERRLAAMDAGGVTMQVLSVVGPGADVIDAAEAPALARTYNDRLAARVRAHPDRFAAFAHLPMTEPDAAADELQRCVEELGFRGALIAGTVRGAFLNDPAFAPLLARAAQLDLPLYLHPNYPPTAVRSAYHDGLPAGVGQVLSGAGWSWHSEVGLHVLRLAASGTLDRHPGLKLLIGHLGEGLSVMLERCDDALAGVTGNLARPVSQAIRDQLWITVAGFFYERPFAAALAAFGAERILYSVDYPFVDPVSGRDFLGRLPVSAEQRALIAHGNADRLLKLL